MNLRIDPEFESFIAPLTDDERHRLERKLEVEGCWQQLPVWTPEDGDGVPILLDGHNRYAWCTAHGASFSLIEMSGIHDRDDAIRWIINNQLARRNLADYRKIELARKDEEILKKQAEERKKATQFKDGHAPAVGQHVAAPEKVNEAIGKKAGVSAETVRKQKFIDRWGTDEEKEALRKGERSIRSVHSACEERLILKIWTMTKQGHTQREMADSLGLSQSNVHKWVKKARDIYGDDDEETFLEETSGVEPNENTVAPSNGHDVQSVIDLTPHEEDDGKTPYQRWIKAFRDAASLLESIKRLGGLQFISRGWTHDQVEDLNYQAQLLYGLAHDIAEEGESLVNVIDA
jgi:hypothetical protein